MATLAEIRAKLAQQDNRSSGNTGGGDNAIFPHWNIAEGTTATVRFLPDGDDQNTFFWVERAMIRLPFAGVKGEANSKATTVQVPCVEMWGDTCPILTEVRTWFKDPSLEEMGRKYWKKKSYLFQGFVTDTGSFKEDKTPENPIRRFIISPQIFNIVKGALMDPEMEDLPTDYARGVDFRVTKTQKGGYADYSTSSWARRERPLSEFEMNAVKQHGLFKLSDFMPKRPSDVELKVMKEMFEASVNGEPFDNARWGQYFRVGGGAAVESSPTAGQAATDARREVKAAVPADDTPPFDVDTPVSAPSAAPASDGKKRAEDILAAIKARSNK